jgi:hypothetical protein
MIPTKVIKTYSDIQKGCRSCGICRLTAVCKGLGGGCGLMTLAKGS